MSKILYHFNDSEKCQIFVCSDLHYNHKQQFIWGKRGFVSSEEHSRDIIYQINKICKPTDILWSLGDLCLNTTDQEFFSFIEQINCKIHMLYGNHWNPILRLYKEFIKNEFDTEADIYGIEWLNKITIWGQYYEFIWNHVSTIFSHYPLAIWNLMNKNSIHLHGHCHQNYKPGLINVFDQGKILDVGWDQFKKPLSFQEIQKIMNKKKFIKKDHHDKETG